MAVLVAIDSIEVPSLTAVIKDVSDRLSPSSGATSPDFSDRRLITSGRRALGPAEHMPVVLRSISGILMSGK